MKRWIFVLWIIILFTANNTYAVVPSDTDYFSFKTACCRIVYSKDHQEAAEILNGNVDELVKYYQQSFGFEFDEELQIVLASGRNQLANGYATVIPLNMTTFYDGGEADVDYFARVSRLKSLAVHEIAHNYQLSAQASGMSKFLKKAFGNNYFPPLFPAPLFTFPNTALPRFMLEGNAILNESSIHQGGRLHSGYIKAMFLALLKSGKITTNRLFNDHLFFPYGEEPYIVGAFFNAFLAEKYGLAKTNRFFLQNSTHFVNPLRLNTAFYEHFGISIYEELRFFVLWFQPEAKNQQWLQGEEIAVSKNDSRLNDNEESIFFVTTDLKQWKHLNEINKKTSDLSQRETTLNSGKVFKIDDKYYTVSNTYLAANDVKFALLDENQRAFPGTEGKIIQDISGDQMLYFDVLSSFDQPQLYLNDKNYDIIHSSAVFDAENNIYYFKQIGNQRILYKNKKPLFYFEGYYGFAVSVDEAGKIYYITNSKYGSSLYMFDPSLNQSYRITDADNVVDAKLLSDGRFLAVAIQDDGFHYIISEQKRLEDQPANNTYVFEEKTSLDVMSRPAKKIEEETGYNQFTNLEYSRLLPSMYWYSDEELIIGGSVLFWDVLLTNSLEISGLYGKPYKTFGISYQNEKYKLNFGASYYYSDIVDDESDDTDGSSGDSDSSYEITREGAVYVSYPIYRRANYTSNVRLSYFNDAFEDDVATGLLSVNHMTYRQFGLSFFPNLYSNIVLYAKKNSLAEAVGSKLDFQHDLPWESYVDFRLQYTKSDTNQIRIYRDVIQTEDISNFALKSIDDEIASKEIRKVGLGLKTVINVSSFYSVFPFSLRRTALGFRSDYYEYRPPSQTDNETQYENITESIASIYVDALFAHTIAIAFSLNYAVNTYDEEPLIYVGLIYDF